MNEQVIGKRLARAPRLIVAATLSVCPLFIVACTVGPNYVRPPVEAPSAFKEVEGWKRAEPRDQALRGAWWKIYGDAQLDTLEEKVNISNQTLLAAEAQFRQARALAQGARANYFPTVTLEPSATYASRSISVNSAGAAVSVSKPVGVYSLPVDVTWDIDLWGKVRRTVEENDAAAQASAADLESARLSAHAEVAQDYFQLRALDAQKVILGEAIVAYAQSLQLTLNRYASGVASKGDVLQAQTQLKTTQAQAIDVGVGRAQLEHAIAVLIGIPPALFSIPITPLTEAPPPIPFVLPSELLERRPDVAAAERRIAAANAQIGVALAAYYPSLSLSAAAGFQATQLSTLLSWPSRFWSVGPAVSQILFDGGLRRAQTDQARAAYDGALATYRETVLTAFQQVEDNLAALRILQEEADVQTEAVHAAEQSLTVETNQYKAGIVSYLQVVTVQQIALSNQQTAMAILGNRLSASVLLIKALGGGWDLSELPTDRDLDRRDRPVFSSSGPTSLPASASDAAGGNPPPAAHPYIRSDSHPEDGETPLDR